MAISSGHFELDVCFMTEADKLKLAQLIEKIDSHWLKKESFGYQPYCSLFSIEDSGFSYDACEEIFNTYTAFILKKYPEAEGNGFCHYALLSCPGLYSYSFSFSKGEYSVQYANFPNDYPEECPECDIFIGDDIQNLFTPEKCKDSFICPNCGATIDLSEYDIEIFECSPTLENFELYYQDDSFECDEINDDVKTVEPCAFSDLIFVTTGLSEEEEQWVKKQVELRGGVVKPKFVVSLNYLIYNPNYDHETTKMRDAKAQISSGKDIKIITLEQFKQMI